MAADVANDSAPPPVGGPTLVSNFALLMSRTLLFDESMAPTLTQAVRSLCANPAGSSWYQATDGKWSPADETVEFAPGLVLSVPDSTARAVIDEIVSTDDTTFPKSFRLAFSEIRTNNPSWPTISVSVLGYATNPHSETLDPRQPDETRELAGWDLAEVAQLLDHDYWWSAEALLVSLGMGTSSRSALTVRGAEWREPVGYVIETRPTATDLTQVQRDVVKELLRCPDLADPRLSAAEDPRGLTVIHRRFEQATSGLPCYVFTTPSTLDRDTFETQVLEYWGIFEEADERVSLAAWDAATDWEMVHDRLGDFGAFAAQANDLLDLLLIEIIDGGADDELRHAIELVRLTLIQGGPDLNRFNRMLTGHLRTLRSACGLLSGFGSSVGLRPAERFAPLTDQATKHAREEEERLASSLVEATTQDVQAVTDAATAVLAERREQSVAALARGAHSLNLLVLIFAAVTIIDLLVEIRYTSLSGWQLDLGRAVVALTTVAAVFWVVRQRRSRSAPSEPTADARRLRTDATEFASHLSSTWRRITPEDGPAFDEKQTGELAALLDRMNAANQALQDEWRAVTTGARVNRRDLLVREAELWSTRMIIFGERPFPLPRTLPMLAATYHLCEQRRFVSAFEFETALGGSETVQRLYAYLSDKEAPSVSVLAGHVREALHQPSSEPTTP